MLLSGDTMMVLIVVSMEAFESQESVSGTT